jgi:hypothetical protein
MIEILPKRVPWNKGRIVGAKLPARRKQVWSSGASSKSKVGSETLLCRSSPSTVSSVAGMSCHSR